MRLSYIGKHDREWKKIEEYRKVSNGEQYLMIVNAGVHFFTPVGNGWNLIVFLAVFGGGGFAMWRVWRDEHTYSY